MADIPSRGFHIGTSDPSAGVQHAPTEKDVFNDFHRAVLAAVEFPHPSEQVKREHVLGGLNQLLTMASHVKDKALRTTFRTRLFKLTADVEKELPAMKADMEHIRGQIKESWANQGSAARFVARMRQAGRGVLHSSAPKDEVISARAPARLDGPSTVFPSLTRPAPSAQFVPARGVRPNTPPPAPVSQLAVANEDRAEEPLMQATLGNFGEVDFPAFAGNASSDEEPLMQATIGDFAEMDFPSTHVDTETSAFTEEHDPVPPYPGPNTGE